MARSAKSAKGKKGKKKGVSVDFTGVESGGRSIEDGWAHAEILEAELTESSNDNEMFKVKVQLTRGKEKAIAYDNLVLTPNSLWKIKGLLEAAGVEVPEGEMDIAEEDLVGLEFEAEVVNENYEGKDRPKLINFRSASDEDDEADEDDEEEDEDEDEEEEEAPKSKKKASKKKAKDEDDEEEEDDEDDDSDDDEEDDSDDDSDDDEDEDEDESDDDEDEDDEDEDEDEEDDEDEEEDEPPKSKKGKSKSKTKLRAGMKVAFKNDKGKTVKGLITSIDGDSVFVEDPKDADEEWELSVDEVEVIK